MKHKSYAKINLALDILGKEQNGYHIVQTILQRINFYDVIVIKPASHTTITFQGDEAPLINTKNNTITKALDCLRPTKSYDITVQKNIPLGAGLGGGSSNAATILSVLNQKEPKPVSKEKLIKCAQKIGVDVPFFLNGNTALGTHFGEKIESLPDYTLSHLHPVLVIPHIRINTKQHYQKILPDRCGHNQEKTQKLLKIIREKNTTKNILPLLHNDFETTNPKGFNDIKTALQKKGAQHVILCGSGSAVLALFNNPCDEATLSQALPNQRILNLHR